MMLYDTIKRGIDSFVLRYGVFKDAVMPRWARHLYDRRGQDDAMLPKHSNDRWGQDNAISSAKKQELRQLLYALGFYYVEHAPGRQPFGRAPLGSYQASRT